MKELVKDPVESETEESDAPEAKRMTRGGGGKNNQSYRKLGMNQKAYNKFVKKIVILFLQLTQIRDHLLKRRIQMCVLFATTGMIHLEMTRRTA